MDSATTTAALYAIRDSVDLMTFVLAWGVIVGTSGLGLTLGYKLWKS